MCLHIRVHFDGQNLVPDEPVVGLPVNQPLEAQIAPVDAGPSTNDEPAPSPEVIKERLRKLEEFFKQPPLGEIPLEALRRENMYDDRV